MLKSGLYVREIFGVKICLRAINLLELNLYKPNSFVFILSDVLKSLTALKPFNVSVISNWFNSSQFFSILWLYHLSE